jgi:hypothetical protein
MHHRLGEKFTITQLVKKFRVHNNPPTVSNLNHIVPYEILDSHGGVTPCGLVGRYQRFGGTHCLQLQASETLISTYKSSWHYNPEDQQRQMNPVHTLPSDFRYLLSSHLRLDLPCELFSSDFPIRILYVSHLPHVSYIPHPSHP